MLYLVYELAVGIGVVGGALQGLLEQSYQEVQTVAVRFLRSCKQR